MRRSVAVLIFAFVLSAVSLAQGAQNNAVPFENNPLVPAAIVPGGPDFTLTVNGAGFANGAVVNWNGSPRVTTFISNSQLTAKILAADIASPATVFLTVTNPTPGGGLSNSVYFQVTTPITTLAFTRNDTDFPMDGSSNLAEPERIISGNFKNDGVPFLAVLNRTCPSDIGCLRQSAAITVEQPESGINTGTYTGAEAMFLGTGDFNGDGILDLVSATSDAIYLSLGNGDGSFQLYQTYSVPFNTSIVSPLAIGDFNQDGHLDLAFYFSISTGSPGIYFLPGNGDGTFGTAVISAATFTAPAGITVGDFNRDGILDIAITDEIENSVFILLGNGDGSFRAPVGYPTGANPVTLVASDFNADGNVDLAVSNQSDKTISILLGNGDGTFKSHVDYPAGITLGDVAFGDYNGDGVVDLAVADGQCPSSGCPATGTGIGSVNVLLGNNEGTFQSHLDFASGGSPLFMASGEFVSPGSQVGRSGFTAVNGEGADTVSIFIPIASGPTNPLPTIGSISPSSALQGSGSFTLTVNGTNFVAGSTVYFGGAPEPTTLINSTQLTALIPAGAIVNAGSVTVIVVSPSPGGGSSNSAGFDVSLPLPTITSLNPQSALVGSPGFTLTINGTNFVSGAFVNFNGVTRATTYVSGTQLTTAILASDLTGQGSISVTAQVGLDISSPATFSILPTNSQPTVGSLVPASTTAGGSSFTLTIGGAGFGQSSVVTFGANNVNSAYVSPTEMQASIPASAIALAGTPFVTVANPGGNPSVVTTFTVNNPIPAAINVSPASIPAGSAGQTVAVTGSNFTATSKVLADGSSRVTTFVSSTALTATLLASDFAQSGTVAISVTNPTPGGGTTGSLALIIADYNVTLQSQSPAVNAGETASFSLVLAPANGTTANAVSFAVTAGLPNGTAASFSPAASFPAGTAQKTVTLSITTTPHSSSSRIFPRFFGPRGLSPDRIRWWMVLLALVSLALGIRTRRAPQWLFIALLLTTACLAACGGGSSDSGTPSSPVNSATGTPAGTYPITVTATSGSASVKTTVTLTVK